MKDYISAAKVYSMASLQKAMHILKEYDLKSKGVGNTSMDEGDLYKELILKLVYLDKVVLDEARRAKPQKTISQCYFIAAGMSQHVTLFAVSLLKNGSLFLDNQLVYCNLYRYYIKLKGLSSMNDIILI